LVTLREDSTVVPTTYWIAANATIVPVRWTAHALQALAERAIDLHEAEMTLASPELTAVDPPHRAVLMRQYFDNRLERQMLLRVVAEESPYERVVITV
jgi:hypothetical protein